MPKEANRVARTTKDGLTMVRVGYIGITCEAPIFIAVEKGFFKEEGISSRAREDAKWASTRTCSRSAVTTSRTTS